MCFRAAVGALVSQIKRPWGGRAPLHAQGLSIEQRLKWAFLIKFLYRVIVKLYVYCLKLLYIIAYSRKKITKLLNSTLKNDERVMILVLYNNLVDSQCQSFYFAFTARQGPVAHVTRHPITWRPQALMLVKRLEIRD